MKYIWYQHLYILIFHSFTMAFSFKSFLLSDTYLGSIIWLVKIFLLLFAYPIIDSIIISSSHTPIDHDKEVSIVQYRKESSAIVRLWFLKLIWIIQYNRYQWLINIDISIHIWWSINSSNKCKHTVYRLNVFSATSTL